MKQQTLKLNEICEIITSPVDKKSYTEETPVLLCNYTDVYYNEFITKDINFMKATASDNEIKRYSLYKGDVVITKDSETPDDIGISTYIAEDIENLVCGYHLAILRPNTKYVNGLYLAYYLKLQQVLHIFGRFANGITRYSLINASYKAVPVLLPPLEEQKKIAEILSLWDKAIEQTKELIAYKEKQKKGLMQALLTGKKRLNGFTDEWKTTKLGEIAYTYGGLTNKTKNDFGSNGNKYISYLDIYQNYYLNEPTNNYVTIAENEIQTELKHGDILFTLSSETPEEVGISCVILFEPNEKIYLNSFSFCLRLKENNILHPLFSAYIFRAEHLRQSINKLAQGATRYNLSKTNFLKLNINIPTSLAEQEAIADILSKADEEIELLNKQLALYTEQKKGLMQNLLTGKVRV